MKDVYLQALIAWSNSSCDWLGYGLAVSSAWNFSTTHPLTASELPGRCITPLTPGLNFQSTCIHERQSNLSPLNNCSSGVGDALSVSLTWSFRYVAIWRRRQSQSNAAAITRSWTQYAITRGFSLIEKSLACRFEGCAAGLCAGSRSSSCAIGLDCDIA